MDFERLLTSLRAAAERNRKRDRDFDTNAGRLSRFLWRFPEHWLSIFAAGLAALDFSTTVWALDFGHSTHVGEAGPLASWALGVGSFPFLFVVDAFAVGAVGISAVLARYLFGRFGFKGYGRAAFVVVFIPYILRAVYAIVNNVILAIRY